MAIFDDLNGKRALVTGASSGIGAALARKLAEAVLRAAQRGTACPGWHGQGACGGKRDGAADKVAAGKGCHS